MADVAILRKGDLLIATVDSDLSDEQMDHLRQRLLQRVDQDAIGKVIIDVSVLDVVDSFATRTLCETASCLRLRGVRTSIVGIQPEVALSMVLLGLSLDDVICACDLEAGLDKLGQAEKRAHA